MKQLSIEALHAIAQMLRRDSLQMTSAAGSGHPSSCLSCAELIAGLFFETMKYTPRDAHNPDNDVFILSKGHAAPILYAALHRAGCIRGDLLSLRKINSPLEGHPMPRSLPWIKVATGSLGQGLAIGVGMALAARLQKCSYRTYVLMGDSECAEGSVWEALNLGAHYNLSHLSIIVDVNRLGQRGETMFGHHIPEYVKRFQAFGWNVLTVNGHDMREVQTALRSASLSLRPTVILAKTFKGRGVSFMENKEGWHGKALNEEQLVQALHEIPEVTMPRVLIQQPRKHYVSRPTLTKPIFHHYALGEKVATREAYGQTLAALACADARVIAIDAEVSNSTHAEEVKKKTPQQFIESYIAEQSMIGIALGLSKQGQKAFASTFAAFLPRAADQLRMAALSDATFTVCGSHCGVSIGEDGASQMGLEDIALFRALPNSTVLYPSDAVSTQKLVACAAKNKGITYIRTTRGAAPVMYSNDEEFFIGDFHVLKESKHDCVVLVGAGVTVHEALKAYALLQEKNISAAVIDLYCIKPFSEARFIEFVKRHGGKIVVAEDHHSEGGIGEMLSAVCANTGLRIERLAVVGVPHSGKSEELLEKYGIDAKGIVRAARRMM